MTKLNDSDQPSTPEWSHKLTEGDKDYLVFIDNGLIELHEQLEKAKKHEAKVEKTLSEIINVYIDLLVQAKGVFLQTRERDDSVSDGA